MVYERDINKSKYKSRREVNQDPVICKACLIMARYKTGNK